MSYDDWNYKIERFSHFMFQIQIKVLRESLKNELKIEKERRVRIEDKVKYRLWVHAD